MRKGIFLSLVVVFIMSSMAWSADIKIGLVDGQKILTESKPGKEARAKLEKEYKPKKDKLEERGEELKKLKEKMDKQSMVLSQEAKQDKELEFRREQRDYLDLVRAFQKDYKAAEKKELEPILEKVIEVINEYGTKNGYTIILDARQSGLVYGSKSVDITDEIIAELNKSWK